MRDFDIIPKGRDRAAANAYKFLSWLFRKNRDAIRDSLASLMREFCLYGQVSDESLEREAKRICESEQRKGKVK